MNARLSLGPVGLLFGILLTLNMPVAVATNEANEVYEAYVENAHLTLRLIPRTPQQMAAFYEARGFPRVAIQHLKQVCFVTALLRNNGQEVLWLDLDQWRFHNDSRQLKRLDRAYWQALWRQLEIPQANRSTFRWTLLPEVRDLHPDEPVGGNIVLPRQKTPFTVQARFVAGKNKRAQEIVATVKDLSCPEDEANP